MNNIEKIYQCSDDVEKFAKEYLHYIAELLKSFDVEQIGKFVSILQSARTRGATIYFLGNGGSAATASHFANDIGIGSRCWEKPYKACSLTDNVAVLTAIANDYGYEDVFFLQLRNRAEAGDLVVAISASGRSANILKAVEYANQHDMITVGVSGFDGGELRKVAQHSIHIQCPEGEYGPVEDVHMVLDHLIGAYLMYDSK